MHLSNFKLSFFCFLVSIVLSHFPLVFKILSLYLAFKSLVIMCVGVDCFGLYCLEFIKLLEYVDLCLSSNLGNFQTLFLHKIFMFLFLPSLLGFPLWVCWLHWTLWFCLFFFIILPSCSLNWIISVDLFSGLLILFFCLLKSAIERACSAFLILIIILLWSRISV